MILNHITKRQNGIDLRQGLRSLLKIWQGFV